MPAQQPTPDFDDELLSAYVDNELTPAERAAVEERLRTDERARQTLAELQRAADALKALPARRLGRDLSANIWAAIDSQKSESRKAGEPAVLTLPPRDAAGPSGKGRGLIWAALAIAAALMLMVLRPGAELGDQGSVAKQGPDAKGSIAKDKAQAGATAPKDAKEDAHDLAREESVGVDAPAASAVRQETANAEPQGAAEPLAEIGAEDGAEAQPETARSRDNIVADGVVTDGIVANGNLADGELATSRLEDKQAPAPRVARGVTASAAPTGAGPSKLAMEAQPETAEGAEAIAADAASREQLRTIEVSAPGVDGVATFERMLARHQITMVDAAADEFAPLAAATSGAAVEAKATTAATESEGAQSGQAAEGGTAQGDSVQGDTSPGNTAQGDNVQSAAPVAILVEASPEAIAAILATLQPQAESRYAFRQAAEKATELDALDAGAAFDGAATRQAAAANNRAWRVPIDAYFDESEALAKIAAAEATAPPAATAAPAGARGGRGGGGGGLGGGGRGGFGGGRGGLDGRALEAREPLVRVMFIVRPE